MSLEPRLSSVPAIRKPTGSFRLVALAAAIGCLTGVVVAAIQSFVVFAQRATLGFAAERRIVLPDHASYFRIALALTCSAVLVTVLTRLVSRWKIKEPIDAVEANALSGGSMGWFDAIGVVVPILASGSIGVGGPCCRTPMS
ncbi:hypothetical protein GGR34_000459 [Microvirga flocculans]|uniref:Chloride channel protein n=1 Tax=Microvirga flocculans TaxID=217168 RepID=A0A7W6IDB6_9HYPH|nr:hypothetical protein [Microvirga flocculans]MBB4038830.1 hypothetical protein [Microvirga flocculans]